MDKSFTSTEWRVINDKEIATLFIDYTCKCLRVNLAMFCKVDEMKQVEYGVESTRSLQKLAEGLKGRKIREEDIDTIIDRVSGYYYQFIFLSSVRNFQS